MPPKVLAPVPIYPFPFSLLSWLDLSFFFPPLISQPTSLNPLTVNSLKFLWQKSPNAFHITYSKLNGEPSACPSLGLSEVHTLPLQKLLFLGLPHQSSSSFKWPLNIPKVYLHLIALSSPLLSSDPPLSTSCSK